MSAISPNTSPEPTIPVLLTPDAAEAIRAAADAGLKALPRRGAEIGGLLTTSSQDVSTTVADGVALVPCEHLYGPSYHLSLTDMVRFRQVADQLAATPERRLLGHFRSCTEEHFDYSPDDVALLRDHLPGCKLMVLVKPFSDGHSRMRAFQLNEEGAWTQAGEFDVYRSTGPQLLPDPGRTLARPPMAMPVPVPTAPPAVRATFRLRPWTVATALGLLLLATAGGIVWRYMRMRPAPSPAGLGLRVEVQGSSLRLTWNHQAHSVQGAKEGILRIDDGSQHREAYLDTAQVSTGSILYRPSSDDVVFRLEIRGEVGAPSSESVRVLDGLRSVSAAEVAVNAPPQTSAPVPALMPAVRQTPGPPTGLAERTAGEVQAGRRVPAPRESFRLHSQRTHLRNP